MATSLAQRLGRCADIDLLGFVDDEPHLAPGTALQTCLGTIHDLPRMCTEMSVDRVLVAFSQSSPTWVVEMLRQLPGQVRISVVPRLFELVTWQSQIEELHGLTVMDVAPPQLGTLSRATKRSLDIVASATALLLLSPIMAFIAIAIVATSGRPVFFRQDRVGFKGKTFRMIKFRTMDSRCRRRKDRPSRAQRRGRAAVQAPQRPPSNSDRAVPPLDQLGRDTPVVQRAPRQDVAGRPAALRPRRVGRARRVGSQALRRAAQA